VAEGGAFWIGLAATAGVVKVGLSLQWSAGRARDMLTGVALNGARPSFTRLAQRAVVPGLRRRKGFLCLTHHLRAGAAMDGLLIAIAVGRVDPQEAGARHSRTIHVVTGVEFERQTGAKAPGPLHPDDAYQGWLLP
jgi:hypothetical protein